MQANHINYEIDISNIWEYERSLFLGGKSPELHAKKVLSKINPVIAKLSDPVGKYGDLKMHAELKFVEAKIRGTKGLYRLDSFVFNGNIYKYDTNIIIDRSKEGFEFWFALKLRQYHNKVSSIASFLDYQSGENFNDNQEGFLKFLDINLTRHKEEFFTEKIIDTVNKWIDSKATIIGDKKGLKIHQDVHRSVIDALIPFFDKKEHELLTTLIKGKEIENKICFHNNANQFIMVFRQLHLNQKIIGQYSDTENWICQYFTYKGQTKKHSDFIKANVHKVLTLSSYKIPKAKRINIAELDFIADKTKEI